MNVWKKSIIRSILRFFRIVVPRIDYQIDENIKVKSDPVLIQILIINLFQNAIRHNIPKGDIHISLNSNSLKFSNTGKPLVGSTESLFKRFKKDNQSGETIGLGLAIVKKICNVNGFSIAYTYEETQHVIEIQF